MLEYKVEALGSGGPPGGQHRRHALLYHEGWYHGHLHHHPPCYHGAEELQGAHRTHTHDSFTPEPLCRVSTVMCSIREPMMQRGSCAQVAHGAHGPPWTSERTQSVCALGRRSRQSHLGGCRRKEAAGIGRTAARANRNRANVGGGVLPPPRPSVRGLPVRWLPWYGYLNYDAVVVPSWSAWRYHAGLRATWPAQSCSGTLNAMPTTAHRGTLMWLAAPLQMHEYPTHSQTDGTNAIRPRGFLLVRSLGRLTTNHQTFKEMPDRPIPQATPTRSLRQMPPPRLGRCGLARVACVFARVSHAPSIGRRRRGHHHMCPTGGPPSHARPQSPRAPEPQSPRGRRFTTAPEDYGLDRH